MKVKTSITLSKTILTEIEKQVSDNYNSRSEFIEMAIKYYISCLIREQQNNRDIEIINNNANRLNCEANEVLDFQVAL